MYKAAIRALMRHSIGKMNAGDPTLLLKMASPDAELMRVSTDEFPLVGRSET